jgi:hypothetical protein
MAIPNYTYLKLKMPGSNGVITVSGSFEHAYACGREHFELATTIGELQKLCRMVVECAPKSNKSTSSNTFHLIEDTKAIGVDPNDPTKTVRIGAQLSAK